MRTTRIDFQEFVEKRTIVDDRLTHLFGARLPPLPFQCQGSSGAVILNDHRMVDRQVICTSIEVLDRVATRRHHLGHELIGFADGGIRTVHEAGLHTPPFPGERIGLILCELAEVEPADALGPLAQNGLGSRRADSLNGSFVLGPKAFAQVNAAATAHVSPRRKGKQHNNDSNTDEQNSL